MSVMGSFADAHLAFPPESMDRFSDSLDSDWIGEALSVTGKASIRRRKLPADRAVWIVIAMCLYANRSIEDSVRQLGLMLPGEKPPAPSAVSGARKRLGAEPLAWLFRKVASAWGAPEGTPTYRGLSLYGIDGTHLRVPDTDANFEAFGKPSSRNGTGDAGYPQVRLVALMNLGSRMLCGARVGGYTETSELKLGRALLEDVPDDSLLILDRGYVDWSMLDGFADEERKRHVLVRVRSNNRFDVLEELPDGTLIVEAGRGLKHGAVLRGRLIEYQHEGGQPSRILTTLLDPDAYPAEEVVRLYHERWELEIGFDEVKTHMLERREALRSKLPEGVLQEVWGLLLTYNLLRREMYQVAELRDLPAKRVSFWTAMARVRDFVLLAAYTKSPGNLPKRLTELDADLHRLILPERRSERRYPRHVKIKMSNYKRNRGRRSPKSIAEGQESPK